MTTAVAPSLGLSGGLDRTKWESFDLLDRFWDSVAIQIGETANIRHSLQDFDDGASDSSAMPTPEIFSKAGSNLMVNVKPDGYILDATASAVQQIEPSWSTLPARRLFIPNGYAPQHAYDYDGSSASASTPARLTTSPSIAVQVEPKTIRRPQLVIPSLEDRRSEGGVTSPSTALLNMASDFLGAVVRLGRSQRSTPAPRLIDDSVSIVASEVSICVVDEDDFRGRQRSVSEYRDCEWVESIPFSSIYSPVPAVDEGMSAEDADVLAKMSWERQLIDAGFLV